MSYQNYVIAAYCVFAFVLGWDYVAPRLQIRQQLRAAKLRAARSAGSKDADLKNSEAGLPLSRE